MAPSATATYTPVVTAKTDATKLNLPPTTGAGFFKELTARVYDNENELKKCTYPNYLPYWEDERFGPLVPFDIKDHGLDADPTYPELLPEGVKHTYLTPSIGSEVTGVQLSKLSPAGRDQLARLVAERGAVAFREQDWQDQPIGEVCDFVRYFGPLHVHPTSGAPKGHHEVHLIFRADGDSTAQNFLKTRINSAAWHSDVTYELQPTGTSFLFPLDVPSSGGDTIFSSSTQAYKRLSPAFRERLHGLTAIHSGIEQVAAGARKGTVPRRDPVISEHPLVRTHPVTGEKSLYVNPQFTRYIVGYKEEESASLLNFLYDHIATGVDFQVRVKWAPKTVVVWDNRVTQHTALVDWTSKERRHLARISPQAEQPYETPFEGAREDEL